VEGADDYAMMQEMLRRRFKNAATSGKNEERDRNSWAVIPDLVLIDGGKGQVSATARVFEEAELDGIPFIGLAKEREEIFLPGRSEPVVLPHSSAALRLLQRVRDESHRFAVTYYTKVHKKRSFSSVLDDINGLGPQKKKALLKRFGSVQNIREASIDEIAAVKGINHSLAFRIKELI